MREVCSLRLDIHQLEQAILKIDREEDLSLDTVLSLIDEAQKIFLSEPQLVKVRPSIHKDNIVFVGDTHGFTSSARAVFSEFDPNKNQFIFLGDYVDRGPSSLGNINYVLAKKLLHRDNIVLLRGNHETPIVNFSELFHEELRREYPDAELELFMRYNELFSMMPYAALVEDYATLAVHGGIARDLRSIDDINRIRKGDLIPSDSTAFQILWNDPSEKVKGKDFVGSSRGDRCLCFGEEAIEDFFAQNRICFLIKGHDPKKEGHHFYFRDNQDLARGMTESRSFGKDLNAHWTCAMHSVAGRVLSVHTAWTSGVENPKIVTLADRTLRIISINPICESKKIKISGKRDTLGGPSVWPINF